MGTACAGGGERAPARGDARGGAAIGDRVLQATGGVVAIVVARLAAAARVVAELAVVARVPPAPVAAEQRAPGEGVEGDVGGGSAELERRLDKSRAEDA